MSAAALVRRPGGAVFVKRHDVRVRTAAQLAAEHAFIGHLRAHALPVPAVLRTVAGATALTCGDVVYEVHEAADGPAAVEVILRLRPDAAFVDVGLPGFDGYEVARRIRASGVGPGPCLIAVTGYGLPADQERARAAGFDFHLVKPIQPSQINTLLRDLRVRPE